MKSWHLRFSGGTAAVMCLIFLSISLSACASRMDSTQSGWWGSKQQRHVISEDDIRRFVAGVRPFLRSPEVHYRQGMFYQARDQHKLAVMEFNKVLHLEPENIKALNARGVSSDKLGDFETAMQSYRAALSLDPELDYVYNNLGYSYFLQGNYTEAVKAFEKAAELDGDKQIYQNNLGMAYARKGDFDRALALFEKNLPRHREAAETGTGPKQARAPVPEEGPGTPAAGVDEAAAEPAEPGAVQEVLSAGAAGAEAETAVSAEAVRQERNADLKSRVLEDEPVVQPRAVPDSKPELFAQKKSIPESESAAETGSLVETEALSQSEPQVPASSDLTAREPVKDIGPVSESTPAEETGYQGEPALAMVEPAPVLDPEPGQETGLEKRGPEEKISAAEAAGQEGPDTGVKHHFTVQAGAFEVRENAEKTWSRLVEKGYRAYLRMPDTDTFYRVRLGEYATLDDARTAARSLAQAENIDTFAAVEDNPAKAAPGKASGSGTVFGSLTSSEKLAYEFLKDVPVEVLNGNGVRRMALRMSNYLEERGFRVDRVGNAAHFSHPNTIIYFRPGYHLTADLLAVRIPQGSTVTMTETLALPDAGVRLVIGRDLARYNVLLDAVLVSEVD